MKFPKYLNSSQVAALEVELVSTELRVHLTRLLYDRLTTDSDGDKNYEHLIIRQNELINRARNLTGLPIYTLETDDGHYHAAEHAWHNAEFELLFRRFNTAQFIEFLGDLVTEASFTVEQLNELFEKDGVSFRFINEWGHLTINLLNEKEIEEMLNALDKTIPGLKPHANIRQLFIRAEDALSRQDYPAVIHASASVFETLAKDLIADPNIDSQPFGSFFDKYRKQSLLPEPLLDFILEKYNLRSRTPLAGHGSRLPPPSLHKDEAITLVEMTKAFVKVEYRLLSEAQVQKQ